MLWIEAVSVSGPVVQIVVPFHVRSLKIFHGPDTTLHNALHDNFEDFDLKLPCSSGLAPNKCANLVTS